MSAYKLKIRNANGETLQLYPSDNYLLIGITGITPADAVINATEIATLDGARFNSSRVQARNIVISIKPRGFDTELRQRRIALYRYAKAKQKVRLFIANDQRDAYIDGYVESLQDAGSIFSKDQRLQISVICPDPFFRDNGTGEEVISFSSIAADFYFPFATESGSPVPLSIKTMTYSKNIYNSGDTDCGMVLTVKALGSVSDPVFYDESTGESMTFDLDLVSGDQLIISTVHGAKSAMLRRGGTTANVINALAPTSSWLKLAPGDNIFYYNASVGASYMELTFSFENLFEGI